MPPLPHNLTTVPQRLKALRGLMGPRNLEAWIVTGTDPHESEYLPAHWLTRRWLSGFTGSSGILAVTLSHAALWTDGRYFLQAQNELAGSGVTLMREGEPGTPTLEKWLSEILSPGAQVGVDEETLNGVRAQKWSQELEAAGLKLFPGPDLTRQAWTDRPALDFKPIFDFQALTPQVSRLEKLRILRESLQQSRCQALFLSALDEVAWVTNLRGSDIPYNPLFYSFLALDREQCVLFCQASCLSPEAAAALEKSGIRVQPTDSLSDFIHGWSPSSLWIHGDKTNHKITRQFLSKPGLSLITKATPVTRLKALKSSQEQQHIRGAMIKDGVALAEFFCWFHRSLSLGETLTEASAARKLKEFREGQKGFLSESFSPIPGWKDHGAIVHYECTPESDRPIEGDGLFLLDTGAHYLSGTTDITRTLGLGRLSEEECTAYTQVLRAHISLALALFPLGTRGYQLDAMARQILWQEGMNYGHGTGHGVGFCLGVHEGPQRLNSEPLGTPLECGMVVSNEPGYYKAGNWGIRLENLVLIVPAASPEGWMCLETLSLCPFDKKALLPAKLTPRELNWLNLYHQKVYQILGPLVSPEAQEWLKEACRSI